MSRRWLLVLALLPVSCDAGDGTSTATVAAPSAAATSTDTVAADAGVVAAVERLRVEMLEVVPHDPAAFTQGLVFAPNGRLFESTGQYGASELRELDPVTGEVLRTVALDDALFGEGLALVGDRLVQLTWREGIALTYDVETLEPLGELAYEGEGWGLCLGGDRLVMSDGSDVLTFRDPSTFEVVGEVPVTLEGAPVAELNELECVGEQVYANVWRTDTIVVIDLATGAVTATIDASGLDGGDGADVLNGIALDPEGELWLAGKLWSSTYRVALVPA